MSGPLNPDPRLAFECELDDRGTGSRQASTSSVVGVGEPGPANTREFFAATSIDGRHDPRIRAEEVRPISLESAPAT